MPFRRDSGVQPWLEQKIILLVSFPGKLNSLYSLDYADITSPTNRHVIYFIGHTVLNTWPIKSVQYPFWVWALIIRFNITCISGLRFYFAPKSCGGNHANTTPLCIPYLMTPNSTRTVLGDVWSRAIHSVLKKFMIDLLPFLRQATKFFI